MAISLRQARLDERAAVYQWLCCSTVTPLFMGPPDYPEVVIPAWEQFLKDFEDFYFAGGDIRRGAVFIVEKDGEGIGCVCYSCFHLAPGCAELDIWFKDVACCGKGDGPQALRLLVAFLRRNAGTRRFLIRPSERNARAIRAYEKAGFVRVPDKAATVRQFLLPEYLDLYGPGDAGWDQTAVLTLD
jgi:diamine N-acetyltransferase